MKKRICKICGTDNEHSRFYDGVTSRCAECHKSAVRKNRMANLSYYTSYDAFRFQANPSRRAANAKRARTEKAQESLNKSRKKWMLLNQAKRNAHIKLGNAVRDGKIEKPENCSICQSPSSRIHGHHADYSKPLDVLWVCPRCHVALHKKPLGEFVPRRAKVS
jgi:hypothetical protein